MPNKCKWAVTSDKHVSKAGVYRSGHQPLGTSCDPDGKDKASNAITLPTTLTTPRIMPKQRSVYLMRCWSASLSWTPTKWYTPLTWLSLPCSWSWPPSWVSYHLCSRCLLGPTRLCPRPPRSISIYVGYTRQEVENDALRFLTSTSGTSRPVLTNVANNSSIIAFQAKTQLGFDYFEV